MGMRDVLEVMKIFCNFQVAQGFTAIYKLTKKSAFYT